MVALICGVSDKPCEKCNKDGEIIVGDKTLCKACLESIVYSVDSISIDVDYAHRQLSTFRDTQRALDAIERIKANLP